VRLWQATHGFEQRPVVFLGGKPAHDENHALLLANPQLGAQRLRGLGISVSPSPLRIDRVMHHLDALRRHAPANQLPAKWLAHRQHALRRS